ncbi:WD40-repeat-containing domain protein [Hygrophoropsis aurantiaca]|uniref:WD40-repeat-containing domain protein n=1 Tax=Hygrophoropsis aurantiaca TaxID=72124 RepID=A0ACB7ZUC2_9AGAM|nr:WD40-repeat-containing domain protein [Hygrophoropsis aurantiaca]
MSTSASPKLDDPAPLLPTKVFEGHASAVRWVAYFHDGKRIISGSRDQTVRIWDIARQEQNGASLKHDSQVNSIALSPDERRLVSGGMGVVLWDLEGRTVMWKKEKEEVDGLCVAYSPDGRLVAARHHEAIVLLNAETGEQIRDPLQFGEPVSCLAFSPDGTRIAAGSHPGNVREFDVATGETVVGPFKVHTKRATSLVYALDGQQFITASHDKSIRVSDAATGQETGDPMLGHESWISQIALSRDGQRLASSSADAIVCVWDLRTRQQIGSPLQSQDHSNLLSVAWSMEDRSIVAGRLDGKIFLWDIPSLNDHSVIPQALAPTTSSPSLPSMSRSRANSTPSSILSLPAGSSPIPPQFPEANTVPDEDDDWEYSTTGSFDSVLDAPADGTQPAQRRKRHRRRGAHATPHSSPPIPAVPNILANAEPESRPPQSQALPPLRNVAVETPAAAPIVTPASRFGPLTRFWMKITAAARWTRKLPRKNINEPAQFPGSRNEMQQSQGDAGENPSESRQVNDSRPRKRRWRRERRNNEVGMIAPAPGYDVCPLISRVSFEYTTPIIHMNLNRGTTQRRKSIGTILKTPL